MKILVAVKRVVDYNVKVHALPDHSGLDIATAKMSMNPFDEIAVEAAVQIKEKNPGTEVVAVSIGAGKTADTLRVALAMGADRAIHVESEALLQPLSVARVLARVAQDEKPDLIVTGKQAIDNDASQVPSMLSAMLDMPVATCVNKIDIDGGAVTVVRETDEGMMTVKADLPAVVSADLRLAEPRYVTLPSMMKAKKKPIAVVKAAEMGLDLADRLTMLEVVEPAGRSAGVKLGSVDELVDVLKNKVKAL